MIIELNFPIKQHEILKSIHHASTLLRVINTKCNWLEITAKHADIFSAVDAISIVILFLVLFLKPIDISPSMKAIVWNSVLFIKHEQLSVFSL